MATKKTKSVSKKVKLTPLEECQKKLNTTVAYFKKRGYTLQASNEIRWGFKKEGEK